MLSGIRQATIFIQYVDMNDKFESEAERLDYKKNTSPLLSELLLTIGYCFRYGPVPLLPDNGLDYDASYDELATPRAPYEEIADYISQEMALAAKDLALTRGQNSAARPTRGAAFDLLVH